MTFQEFKDEYFILNKDLLDKVEPALHHDMMLAAYTKLRDKLRCRDYYQENKEQIDKRHQKYYDENKKEICDKRKEIITCECGTLIKKWNVSRHFKTAKHAELLKKQKETKQQHEESIKNELPELNIKKCNSCNVELIENYKKCECRKCEDWGGCKDINGYYYLVCPQCKKDFETTKTDYWEPSYRHGVH